jgi:flagellar assembly protein FliH
MRVVVLPSTFAADPMFGSYGGVTPAGTAHRWHLPEGVAYKPANAEKAQTETQAVDDTISLAKDELNRLLAEAESKGREAAITEAVEAQQTKMAELEGRLQQMLDELVSQLNQHILGIEKAAVKLSIELAHKLIGQGVEVNPEYIVDVVKDALKHVGGASIKGIRVSPADYEFINVIGVFKKLKEVNGSWEFAPDEEVKSGCVVDTSAGEIDFQLDGAWERIKDKVIRVIS